MNKKEHKASRDQADGDLEGAMSSLSIHQKERKESEEDTGDADVGGDIKATSSGLKKLFVGGLGDTTETAFHDFFSKYGEVQKACLKKDRTTGQSRGFGFVSFRESAPVDKILSLKQVVLDTKVLDCKLAVPRKYTANWGGRRLFVGGIPPHITPKELKEYFSGFGSVITAVIKMDDGTKRSRGFGFVVFASQESVETVLSHEYGHNLGGRRVQCKVAIPKHEIDAEKQAAQESSASSSPSSSATTTPEGPRTRSIRTESNSTDPHWAPYAAYNYPLPTYNYPMRIPYGQVYYQYPAQTEQPRYVDYDVHALQDQATQLQTIYSSQASAGSQSPLLQLVYPQAYVQPTSAPVMQPYPLALPASQMSSPRAASSWV